MDQFRKNTIALYGKHGKDWLERLPAIRAAISKKYQLSALNPVSNMSFNYVCSGMQNEKPIMLKLGFDQQAFSKEADCLQAFEQYGSAKVIATEPGMIIMQKLDPGMTLKSYFPQKDDQALTILCKTILQLHKAQIPKHHHFFPLKKILSILDQDLDIPQKLLDSARALRDDLLLSTKKEVLLHGDLHHENLLQHGNDWKVIDPKGFIGDPLFDLCAFILGPIPELLQQNNRTGLIQKRIKICAHELQAPQQRIQDWLYVKSVLGWAWCLDDNMAPDYFKGCVSLLEKIR